MGPGDDRILKDEVGRAGLQNPRDLNGITCYSVCWEDRGQSKLTSVRNLLQISWVASIPCNVPLSSSTASSSIDMRSCGISVDYTSPHGSSTKGLAVKFPLLMLHSTVFTHFHRVLPLAVRQLGRFKYIL